MSATSTKSKPSLSPAETARAYIAAGFSVIPISLDGSKRPDWRMLPREWIDAEAKYKPSWKPFQDRLAEDAELQRWYDSTTPAGIGIVCGTISGGLVVIDIDELNLYAPWCECVEAECPGLIARLTVVQTPRPGFQVYCRVPDLIEFPHNDKLATDEGGKVLIETRAEGGYVLAPGSPPECHPSGREYQLHSGPAISALNLLTPDELEVLLACARSFHRHATDSTNGASGYRPGDAYNERVSWDDVLTPHGWQRGRQSGDVIYWRRPSKDAPGHSATSGRCRTPRRGDLLYVFSSNAAPFESEKSYSKFEAYTVLNHSGDYKVAAAALARCGFGDAPRAKGKTKEPRQESSQTRSLLVRTLASVQPLQTTWLWRGYIPLATLSILDGDPGLGKSTITADLAARVSRGGAMPPLAGGTDLDGPADVLILNAEDSPEGTIRPRVDAARGDLSRVHVVEATRLDDEDESPPVLPADLDILEEVAQVKKVKLIVIDPFVAYLDGELDAHRDQDVRRCLHRLKNLAERTGAAVLSVRHLNKLTGGPALYRGGGSIGISGAARSVLMAGKNPADSKQLILAAVKCNLCTMPPALTYSIETAENGASMIGWGDETTLSADDILGARHRGATASQECKEQLLALLADGPREVDEVEAELKANGYSKSAIREARKLGKVITYKEGFGDTGRWLLKIQEDSDEGRIPPGW
jgi:hypothetical protein